MATLNDLLRSATASYLSSLNMDALPSPSVIEQELLDKTNAAINIENVHRSGRERLAPLKTLTFGQVADVMIRLHHVVRVPAGAEATMDRDRLGIYVDGGPDEGIYVTSPDSLRSFARAYNYSLTTTEFKELYAALMDAAPRRLLTADPDLVPVQNGVFNYKTKELQPFSPDFVFTSKIETAYVWDPPNPVITMPDGEDWDVESWMADLSDDPDVVSLLWMVISAVLRPFVSWGKLILPYSEKGNNGKGTYVQLIRNLLGHGRSASVPLADFGKDFQLEPLKNAMAVIVDENDIGMFLDQAGSLKAVVTHDAFPLNRKGLRAVSMRFYGLVIECINEMPRFRDKSDSMYRRQLPIPFLKNFKDIERRYIKDDYIARQDVREYVLWKALQGSFYELSQPKACLDLLEEMKLRNDPIRESWKEFEDQFVWDLLPLSFLYDLYLAWFGRTNPQGSPVGRNAFTSSIIAITDEEAKGHFHCLNKETSHRHNGTKMAATELLIAEYDLTGWTDRNYTGKDRHKRSQPELKDKYRGLLRQ